MRPKAPAAYSLDTVVTVLDSDGREHDIDATIWFNASYTRARVSGPPEDCYPEDSEFEIVRVDVDDESLPYGISKSDVEAVIECDETGKFEQECWDEYMTQEEEV